MLKTSGVSQLVRKSPKTEASPSKYVMMDVRVICGLLLSLVNPGSVESVNWVDGVTRGVIKNWDVRYGLIVEQFVRNESSLNPQVHNLRLQLMQIVPTITCKVGDFVEGRGDSSIDNVLNENAAYNASTVLYVIATDVSRYAPLKPTIESLVALSEWNSKKCLLLLISPKPRKKLERLLKFTWRKKLLDFTIIELVEPRVTAGGSLMVIPPIIHRYNPFKKEYTRSNWTLNESFFMGKALNMWGYPLKIGILHEPPMSFIKFDESNGIPVSLRGANINMVKLMAKKLNFTPIWIPIQHFSEIVQDPTPSGLYELMNSDKIDLLASMSPHHTNLKEYRIHRTTRVFIDRMCPVVPITRSVVILSIADICRFYLIVLIILIGLWIPTYLLKFDRRYWKPMNIFKLFLGVGWSTVPNKNAERIVFAFILFLSVMYSSTIIASTAKARFIYDKTASIKSFEELDDSGLTPVVSSFLFNKTFTLTDGSLANIEKKSMLVSDINGCPFDAAKYKNVTCIMGERDMLLTMRANENYRHRLKILPTCFWSDSYGFLLGKNSPYAHHLNKVIHYTHVSGFISKWYTKFDYGKTEDWPTELGEDDTPQIDRNDANPVLVRQLTTIIIMGLILSLFVFIGEIIVWQTMQFKERK